MIEPNVTSFDPGAHAPALTLVLEGARRDAQWALVAARSQRLIGGRIRDRAAAEQCPVAISEGLRVLGAEPENIEAICIGVGPGSFAGLRIMLSFGKGLALSTGARVVGVPSLDAMLYEPREPHTTLDGLLHGAFSGDVHRLALMNAFAGMVFAQGRAPDGSPWIATDAYEPESLRRPLAEAPALDVLCDGPLPMQEALGLSSVRDLRSTGADIPYGVIALGLERLSRGERDDPLTLLPVYGRASSAELKQRPGVGQP